MPLKTVRHDELHHLYQKIFHPFCDIETNFDPSINQEFECIRTGCKYYTLTTTGTPSFNQTSDKLYILHLNVRSLLNTEKFEALITFLHLTGIPWDIVCISETWLNPDVEKYRNIEGYTTFFHSRVGRTGGGAAIYIRTTCVTSTNRLKLECPTGTESVFVQCHLPCSKVIIGQVYRPPDSCPTLFNEEMLPILDSITRLSTAVIITGDFNFDLFNISNDASVERFFNMFLSYGFLPLISLPTRQTATRLSLLDNIYCNNITCVGDPGVVYDDLSDHFPIYITIKAEKPKVIRQQNSITSFNYNRVDDLRQYLRDKLHDLSHVNDPNVACERITQSYSHGINKYSTKFVPSRRNTPIKPWITPGILASINRKNKLFLLKNTWPTEVNIIKYRRYRNTLAGIIREAKKMYIHNELKEAGPKKTWSILKELTTGTPQSGKLPDTFKTSNGVLEDRRDIAEGFNTFFTGIGNELKSKIRHSNNNPLDYIPTFIGTRLDEFENTDENEVKTIVNDMRSVGGGHDEINTRIFKSTFTAILTEIVHFMNICLQQGVFPASLKRAVIKPIYKAGDKQLFNNYRPISLLPVISKLLEKIIYIRLNRHLNINDILCDNQFGFRSGRSTYMPLVLLQDKITSAFEENSIMCGIYLDLRKAFDTVNIDILLKKLHKYGIVRSAFAMLKSYLHERTQCVQVDHDRSSFLPIQIGVPQGSILGPLLFILYINDFPQVCGQHITTFLYADDTAIFIEGKNDEELQTTLNTLMPKVAEWFITNQLSLNTDKTFYQIYTNKRSEIEVLLQIDGAVINRAKTVKYLGIFIDEDIKWKTHIAKLQTVLSRNVGIISRVKYFLDTKHLLLLYNSLVLSHVNYCCFLYSNTYSTNLNELEKLQKRAVRIVDRQPRLAHTAPIFKKLKLLRLKDIGNQQMILLLHRKLKANLPNLIDQLFETSLPSRSTRSIKHFEELFTYKVYRTHTVSWAGPRLWNSVIGPMFPMVQTVPFSKCIIKRMSKSYFLSQY